MKLTSIKPLLILDLDETVIYYDVSEMSQCRLIAHYQESPIVARPGLDAFLQTVEQYFQVAVWTAANESYANIIVEGAIKPVLQENLSFVWSSDRCVLKRDFESAHSYGWIPTKPLVKVKRGFDFPVSRMLIVEDDPLKVTANYGSAIIIRAFEGASEDNELSLLASYLISIHNQPDFRKIEKRGWRSAAERVP